VACTEEVREESRDICSVGKINTLRTGDADLRFYIAAVQDG